MESNTDLGILERTTDRVFLSWCTSIFVNGIQEETKRLLNWKNQEHRKPLMLRGARQVGKTGRDLLFFDEIQSCPKAIMALRYFYEEMPQLHVIAAGSLLEFAMRDVSFPVGRIHMLPMNPMGLIELFL